MLKIFFILTCPIWIPLMFIVFMITNMVVGAVYGVEEFLDFVSEMLG